MRESALYRLRDHISEPIDESARTHAIADCLDEGIANLGEGRIVRKRVESIINIFDLVVLHRNDEQTIIPVIANILSLDIPILRVVVPLHAPHLRRFDESLVVQNLQLLLPFAGIEVATVTMIATNEEPDGRASSHITEDVKQCIG